jgi:AraC-like DNA-binding protein
MRQVISAAALPAGESVSMSSIQGVATTLDKLGVETHGVLMEAGVAPEALAQSFERVPIQSLSQIISRAVSSELGPLFGLKFAENVHATTYHCYGLMLISSPTLRQFCTRLARYYAWVTTNKSVSFDVVNGRAMLVYHCHEEAGDSPMARLARLSGWAATWVRMLRMVSSPSFAPVEVQFSSPPPLGFVDDYEHYFRCSLKFGSAIDALCFDASVLDEPLAGGNAELARRSERQVFDHLRLMGSVDLETQIRMALFELLPMGAYDRQDIAAWLGMEDCRLKVALQQAGLSHHQIVLRTRQELAAELVSHSGKSINEISYHLGFSDCSNFARSYRKWFGCCPSERRAGGV